MTDTGDNGGFLNLRQAADVAGCSYDTVRRLARTGVLPTYRRGTDRRCVLVAVADIRRLAEPSAA